MQAKWIAGSAVALVLATGFGIAQIAPAPTPADPNRDVLLERLHQGSFIEQYVAQQVEPLRSADRDSDGLDRDDVALAHERRRAEMRASNIAQVLRNDLDDDLRVTRSELERAERGGEEYRGRSVASMLERFDADGDEVITLDEAAGAADEGRPDTRLDALLKLDPSGDGILTAQELRTLAEQAFESVDRDRDGKISADEYRAIADRVRDAQLVQSAAVCDLPPIPDRAQLVVFGGYEGDSISTVAVGGPDKETNLIEVAIEPGSTPLYLVLTSYHSMVWQLTGATDRVAHVVVSSSQSARPGPKDSKASRGGGRAVPPPPSPARGTVSAAGVTGLPAHKVTIAASGCPPYFNNIEKGEAKPAIATLERTLSRAPDKVVGHYSVQRVSLPSGELTKAKRELARLPNGFDAQMWEEATRFWPGGLVAVDPQRVVARARVEPYKVLPSQMGLAQLLGSGAIQRITNGKFRIVRPIPHMPPSMGGAHSVTLVLAKGVPMPPGSPGHSCVIRESDGTADGAACR